MHTKSFIYSVIMFSAIFSVACQQRHINSANNQNVENQSVNSPVQTSDDQILQTAQLDDKTGRALLDTLADERRAQAFYGAVIDKFGSIRPFSNIIEAEKTHESMLLPLFEKYGLKVPENEFKKETQKVPATIAEACRQGIEDEKANRDMYEKFLAVVKETDIRDVFTYLRDASQNNHLPAFERCAQGGGRGQFRN